MLNIFIVSGKPGLTWVRSRLEPSGRRLPQGLTQAIGIWHRRKKLWRPWKHKGTQQLYIPIQERICTGCSGVDFIICAAMQFSAHQMSPKLLSLGDLKNLFIEIKNLEKEDHKYLFIVSSLVRLDIVRDTRQVFMKNNCTVILFSYLFSSAFVF